MTMNISLRLTTFCLMAQSSFMEFCRIMNNIQYIEHEKESFSSHFKITRSGLEIRPASEFFLLFRGVWKI